MSELQQKEAAVKIARGQVTREAQLPKSHQHNHQTLAVTPPYRRFNEETALCMGIRTRYLSGCRCTITGGYRAVTPVMWQGRKQTYVTISHS